MTKSCPGCGATAPAEARYCRHCGTALRATTGPAGGATISPLANTEPLDAARRAGAGDINAGMQHVSTPPDTHDNAAHAATLPSAPLPSADQTGDSGEITISVVRPAQHAAAGASSEVARPSAPLSSTLPARAPARAAAPAHERRALRIWLAAGLCVGLLACIAAAGIWYVLRERRAHAPAVTVDAPPAPPDARTQAQAQIAEAQSMLAAGNPVGATQSLRAAVALDPRNAEAHRQLAQLLLESGARQTAIEELRVVTSLEPNDKDAWRQLAEAQFAEGAYADAADSYHALMDVSNEAATDDLLQLAYADALRLAGRTDGAHALYRRLATSPLADVARTSRQRLADLTAAPEAGEAASAPPRVEGVTDGKATQPTPTAGHDAPPLPADHYERGVQMWGANRADALAEFRAAAATGNPDAYYYLGLSLAEGRDPHTLGRAELVAALGYFQRARAGRFGAQARRYEDQLGQEFDRRRKQ